MENLYRARAADTFKVDAGLAFLVARGTAETFVVDAATAAILGACSAERSIDSHVEHAAGALRTTDTSGVRARVNDLVRRGLLIPVTASDRTSHLDSRGAAISALAIVTADRPMVFARCLSSYLRHLAANGRALPIIVVDASSDAVHASAVAEIVDNTRRRSGATIDYLASSSRSDIRRRAITNGARPSVMDWLLPAVPAAGSAGAARNHLLLSSVGRAVLSVDDDTVGEVWASPDQDESVGFVGHTDPRETRCFATRTEAVAFARSLGTPPDLIAQHEALLGRALQSLAECWPGGRHVEDVCGHLLPVFEGPSLDWRVRATWTGVAGDAATHCPYPVLFVAGETRQRLAASADALSLAVSSREVVRAVRRPTVTHEPSLMTYCAAIDGRTIVPPFSSAIGNEDRMFAAMLRMCDPSAFVGQVPCGVVHDSSRTSVLEQGVIPSAHIRTSDVVEWLAAPWAGSAVKTDAAERMRGLGEYLSDCGHLSPASWRARVTAAVMDARRRTLVAVDQVLSDGFDYPRHYRQAIRGYQQAVLDAIRSPDAIVPLEFRGEPGLDSAMEALQKHFVSFGEALMAWPAIWESQKG
jgi:hypothetical protein